MKHYISLIIVLNFISSFAFADKPLVCKKANKPLSKQTKLFKTINNLADLHVYYGSIEGRKVGNVYNVSLYQDCKTSDFRAVLIHFNTKAKINPRSKAREFHCYSKSMTYNQVDWRNLGTFCSLKSSDVQRSFDKGDFKQEPRSFSNSSESANDYRDEFNGQGDEFSSYSNQRNREDHDEFDQAPRTDSVDSLGPDEFSF